MYRLTYFNIVKGNPVPKSSRLRVDFQVVNDVVNESPVIVTKFFLIFKKFLAVFQGNTIVANDLVEGAKVKRFRSKLVEPMFT